MPIPVTNYGIFIDGNYITNDIQFEKKILALVKNSLIILTINNQIKLFEVINVVLKDVKIK